MAGKNGKHERRNVTVGHKTDNQVEIVAGISVGDKILLSNPDDESSSDSEES